MTPREATPPPEFDELSAALRRSGLAQSAAETHGLALGLAIGGAGDASELWRRELYSDLDPADVLAAECRGLLDRLFADVCARTRSGTPLQLELLLPAGIEVDAERLAALRDWCQGFLYGFGLGGAGSRARLSGQTRELLHDIAEFTRLDIDAFDNDAADQAALIEVEEYLREAVMLIRDELSAPQENHESQ